MKMKQAGILFYDVEAQKGLSNNDFVAITKGLTITRGQSFAAIDKSSVRRTQIFEKVLTVAESYSRLTSRHFSFRIIRIQIYIGEDSSVGVPTSNLRFDITQHELLTSRPPFFDYQPSMRSGRGSYCCQSKV